MTFTVPPHGMRFYEQVVERSHALIHTGIWEGIHPARLRTWLNNFTTDAERYLCACLLDSLIYRSEDQTTALTAQVFQRSLPDLVRQHPCPLGQVSDWISLFCGIVDPQVRLVAVLKPSDPPGKSGDVIARLLKRGFQINQQWVIEPHAIPKALAGGVSAIIFIDDFLGTGHQFWEVINANGIALALNHVYVVYAPLTAHIDGIDYLHQNLPTIRVCAGEILDWSHSVFHKECRTFEDETNTLQGAKEFYYEMLEKRGIVAAPISAAAPALSAVPLPTVVIPPGGQMHPAVRSGYGHLELAYAFHHAIPDNCLPAFWWSKSPNWSPLFSR